jgi:hypothetical protein
MTLPRYLLSLAACLLVMACSSPEKGPTQIVCGGGMSFPCPKGMYCDLGDECGGFDNKGICKIQPKNCPLEDNPVCGCDQINYDSPCYARAQGVTIAHTGECIRQTIQREKKRKKMEFTDTTTHQVDGSGIEAAGDVVDLDEMGRPIPR